MRMDWSWWLSTCDHLPRRCHALVAVAPDHHSALLSTPASVEAVQGVHGCQVVAAERVALLVWVVAAERESGYLPARE